MADNKKIIIDVETNINDKDLDKVSSNIDKIGDGIEKAQKGLKGMSHGAKKLTSSFKEVAKAMGFVKLLEMLKDVFMQNQKVADLFATAMGTINIVFNELVEAIAPVIEKIAATTNGFEGITNLVKGAFGVALNTIKLAFNGIAYILTYIQKAWEESPFGNGDPKKIEELSKRLEKFGDKVGEAGDKIVQNGKLVVDNVGKALDEVGQTAEGVSDAVDKTLSEDKIKKANKKAKAQVAALKAVKIATAQLGGVVAEYERKEEKLRQTRDDATKSIQERKEASDKLKLVIEEESKAQLELVKLGVRAAELNYSINKSDENRIALIEAKNKVKEVEAQIEGKVTEQKMADIAVTREGIDLEKSAIKYAQDRAAKHRDATASLIEDDLKRLQAQEDNLKESQVSELKNLKDNIDRFKEGTQARLDAENEYYSRKQEIEDGILAKEKEISDKRKELNNNLLKAKEDANNLEIEADKNKLAAITGIEVEQKTALMQQINDLTNQNLITQRDIELSNVKLTQEERANIIRKYNDQIIQNNKDTEKAILEERISSAQKGLDVAGSFTNAVASLGDALSNMHRNNLKKGSEEDIKAQKAAFKRQKALSIVMAAIDGAKAVTSILAQYPKFDGGIAMTAAIVATGVSVAAQIAAISSKQFNPETGDASAPSSDTKTNIPTPTSNALGAGSTIGLGQATPLKLQNGSLQYIKVYVSETDIRGTMAKVDVIENRSRIK
jgi:hypothetical protein